MKIFTESEAVGARPIPCGSIVRLNDGREVVKVRHSMHIQDNGCKRNSGELCTFIGSHLCTLMRCNNAIYLEKQVYLRLKLVGDVE